MRRDWSLQELSQHWELTTKEKQLALTKRGVARLGFSVLLKAFQYQGRFPGSPDNVAKIIITHLAQQVGVDDDQWHDYDWDARAIKYHRAEIRALLGFRKFTVDDSRALVDSLSENHLRQTRKAEMLEVLAYEHLRGLKIEPPTPDRLDRPIRSAQKKIDQRFCRHVFKALPATSCGKLDLLLKQRHDLARIQMDSPVAFVRHFNHCVLIPGELR